MNLNPTHNLPPPTIYQCETYSKSVDALVSACIDGKQLNDKLADGGTPGGHLDRIYDRACQNDHESIELLHNLALGASPISVRAQQLLCHIVARTDNTPYEAAATVRSCAQNLISQPHKSGIQNITHSDSHQPTLLLLASSTLAEEGEHSCALIPEVVKEKVISVNRDDSFKPQWWVDNKPQNGVFDFLSGNFTEYEAKDYLVMQHEIAGDGACQFRAMLYLMQSDSRWLTASSQDVLHEIQSNNGWHGLIKQSIADSINFLRDSYLDPDFNLNSTLPQPLQDFFENSSCVDLIYDATIGNGQFSLYSPKGIASAINGLDYTNEVADALTILADNIGHSLIAKQGIPIDSMQQSAYAEHINGNHYNLVIPLHQLD